MLRLPHGGFIIDTPGIRTFEPMVKKHDLDTYFKDFSPYLGKCKFKGCTHRHEPMCSVKEAVNGEEINLRRYKSYCKLYESL